MGKYVLISLFIFFRASDLDLKLHMLVLQYWIAVKK